MASAQPAKQDRISPIFYCLLLLLLLNAPDLIYCIETKQYFLGFIGTLSIFSLLCLPVYFFRNNLKLYIYFLIPFFILLPCNFASVLLYNFPINDSSVFIVSYTNIGEFSEQVAGNWTKIIVGLVIYFAILSYLVYKAPKTIPSASARYVSIISVIVILLVPFGDTKPVSYLTRLRGRYYSVYPVSLLYSYAIYHNQDKIKDQTEAERNNFTFHIKQDPKVTGRQIHVLIIGESARYNNWGINGYARNTTPMLSKRANLLSYSNVATGGYITEYAVPLILTGVGADNFITHYHQKSIVGAFNEAGFTSYWMANQIYWGHLKIHSLEAQKQYMISSDYRATKNLHRDMELLGTLKQALADTATKKFIVLHTLGSHYEYSSRYPDNFDFYKPSNKTVFTQATDSAAKNIIVNSYDNTIRYTDVFIDSVISLIAAQQAVASVTYISDHGENLFDDARNLSQHAYPIPSRYVAQVPLFIWYSPQLDSVFPEKINNLKKYINAKVSSQNIIYTITGLAGLTYPAQDSMKNMTSPYFTDNAQLIMGANDQIFKAATLK